MRRRKPCRKRVSVFVRNFALTTVGCTCILAQARSAGAPSSPLRYQWQVGQVFAYEVEVTADRDEYVDRMKGVISYSVQGVEGDQLQVEYRGGVKRNKEMKPGQSSGAARPPFGPRFGRRGGPGGPRSPFDSVPFKGLTTTTNLVTLTPQGTIQRLEGDSQLPYLLGNLSILVFEPLPEDARSNWSVGSGVTITEEKGRRIGPPHFGGPPRPSDRQEPDKQTAGSESVSLSIQKDDGRVVTANKRYQLNSPLTDGEGFQITGSGTWSFNRELGIPESLDFNQQLVVQDGATTVTLPVAIKYRRLSESELRAHQADEQKQQEELKQRLAEMQQNRAQKPLSSQDKNAILEDLQSDKWSTVLHALQRLNRKSPTTPDRRIAAAIQALSSHDNPMVRKAAQNAAEKWASSDAPTRASGSSPQAGSAATPTVRTWSDDTGQFTIEAEFLGLAEGNVRLRRTDGQEITVPLARLSAADQKAAQELSKKAAASSNPFNP